MIHHALARYRKLYSLLLGFYPKPFRERHRSSMEQTFSDLLRECAENDGGVFGCALWMFAETSFGIVKMNLRNAMTQNKRILRMILVVLGILMIPFIASFLTDEMQWSVSDFIFMGVLLLAAGTIYEIGVKVSSSTPARIGFGVAVFTGFVLIWMNLAVGIIGSEDNPANVLFAAVIAVAFFGAIIAKFEAPGMAKALTVTAVAQFLVPIIAIVMFRPDFSPGVAKVFVLNLFFVGLWLTSATFFRKAAELGPPSAPGRA